MNVRSLAKELLGKEIQELALEDLRTFFLKERKESDVLEFKSYSTEKGQKDPKEHLRAVHKTICAFLNSQGGVLVWGAPIGQKRESEKEKVFVGELTKVEVDLEDDQIADGILQSVSPMPSGFTFKKLGDGTSRIYVFEVKSSPYSPHQIKGAYFARFTAQTHPAPHYLVEALMRRVTFPNIAAYVQLNAVSKEPGKVVVSFIISCVNHSRLQNERNITVTAYTSHGSFPRNNFTPKNIDISSDGKTAIISDSLDLLHYGVNHHLPFDVNISDGSGPSDDELIIQVAVGGRFSPMKYSSYIIGLGSNHQTIASRIRPIKINILANDNEDSMIEKELRRLKGQ